MVSVLGYWVGVFYCSVLFSSLGATSWVLLLFMLEFLSWLFIWMVTSSWGSPSEGVLKYLLVQALFVTCAMFGVVFGSGVWLLGLALKLAVPPFHLWVWGLLPVLTANLFWWFSTFHKLLPLVIWMVLLECSLLCEVWLLALFIYGSYELLGQGKLVYILFYSSLVHATWFVLAWALSKALFLFYWFFYQVMLLGLVSLQPQINWGWTSSIHSWEFWFLFVVFLGLPPFLFFWLKLWVAWSAVMWSWGLVWVGLVAGLVVLLGYFRVVSCGFGFGWNVFSLSGGMWWGLCAGLSTWCWIWSWASSSVSFWFAISGKLVHLVCSVVLHF